MPIDWSKAQQAEQAAEAGVAAAAEALLDEVRSVYIPVKSGALSASGMAKAKGLQASVGFTKVYGKKQHEREDFEHRRGQAKFLSEPTSKFGPQLEQHVAEAMSRVLGG
ncbi:hypothetical protein CH296_11215 [Rhodococcus sp. 14-2496-1d]|uniref:hypothetical protein n=1 Tax=Rhodococcus sp. 14-2496-1d TaxID=2023146 RepID=UPI000B9A4A9A|nr:hypothetical protein [Rhodococcus sp. 14-2496-1d]OZF33197.1 hypothetical protein CH296_11215 [Rhodococcus sp. 14-2496-1d]